MMQASSTFKHARLSAQKARLVADQIRGLSIDKALHILNYSLKKGAGIVKKALMAAVANAEHNYGADIDELKITSVFVDEGPVFKRMHPRAKGRGSRILKRTSHITVMVSDS